MGIIGLGIKKLKTFFNCYILHIHDIGFSKSEYSEYEKMFKVTTKCKKCGKTYIDYVEENLLGF